MPAPNHKGRRTDGGSHGNDTDFDGVVRESEILVITKIEDFRDHENLRFSDDEANNVERPGAFPSTHLLFNGHVKFLKSFPESLRTV